MPVMVSVPDLQPGMRLYRSLYNGYLVMLPAGKVLDDDDIRSLRRRFPDVHLSIGDPVLDDLVEFQDDSNNQEVAAQVQQRLARVLTPARQMLKARTSLEGVDLGGLQRSVGNVITYMQENPVTAALLLSSEDWANYLQEHPANVFYLSLLIGGTIRQYVHQERQRQSAANRIPFQDGMNLTALALGALFHDIGMVPLESLYGKARPLSPEEQNLVRQHPDTGAAMLPKEFNPLARLIVRTHHENQIGTGYPARVQGEKLHIFSRIIRVADAYDAACSPQVYKQAKTPVRALWEMTAGPYARLYDPVVLKVFAGLIQPFPIGAKIRLNCGRFGVVVRHNRVTPFRPTIIIAFDENGRRFAQDQLEGPLDLTEHPEIRLVEFRSELLQYLDHAPSARSADQDEATKAGSLFACVFP